jgi:hypothetical protein
MDLMFKLIIFNATVPCEHPGHQLGMFYPTHYDGSQLFLNQLLAPHGALADRWRL